MDLDSLSDKELIIVMTAALGTLISRYEFEEDFDFLEEKIEQCAAMFHENYDEIWDSSIAFRRGDLNL